VAKTIPSGAQMVRNKPTIEALVVDLLTKYPQARGDDMILLWRFYRNFSGIRIQFGQFKQLLNAPSAESITRARRKVQEKREDLRPTKRVLRKRRINEEACRQYYGAGMLTLPMFESEEV